MIEPIFAAEQFETAGFDDDTQYCIDLGLLERRKGEGLLIANAICREVIPRELTHQAQIALEMTGKPVQWYLDPGGCVNGDACSTTFNSSSARIPRHGSSASRSGKPAPSCCFRPSRSGSSTEEDPSIIRTGAAPDGSAHRLGASHRRRITWTGPALKTAI